MRVWRQAAAALAFMAAGGAAHAQPTAAPALDPQNDRAGLQAYQRGDVASAMALLRGPARAGHAASQSLLGFILERADFTAEAATLWRDAAAQGDAEAHAGLANLYLTGRGLAKDEKQALRHFSEAARLGHAASAEVVALAWSNGAMGADAAADPAAARAALLHAAGLGHLPSADTLAQAYRSGRFGLAVDEAQAAAWQRRAADWRRQRAAVTAKAAR